MDDLRRFLFASLRFFLSGFGLAAALEESAGAVFASSPFFCASAVSVAVMPSSLTGYRHRRSFRGVLLRVWL